MSDPINELYYISVLLTNKNTWSASLLWPKSSFIESFCVSLCYRIIGYYDVKTDIFHYKEDFKSLEALQKWELGRYIACYVRF